MKLLIEGEPKEIAVLLDRIIDINSNKSSPIQTDAPPFSSPIRNDVKFTVDTQAINELTKLAHK